ncbi:hydroxyacid dehydrogenase [Schizosaccharomyces japonicus yFS275]|uniref:Hydroxyacid dehydrogenase n=1 Tax=Schizosaccharomyces japonicus (strain yFS275 / FY16936) TaxID=402676 RepID=B6JXX0_SCHJY|nr:hydroxyacid dehydrogenase [Schizosaccharomyces japonicus yFS275]EEB06388.1 hydroxyacid dehydrogenase [Schizosaccharomyces japonicus yFS275]
MSKPAILLCGSIVHSHEMWSSLSSIATLKIHDSGSRLEFVQKCKSGEFNDVKVIVRTAPSVLLTGRFDEELVAQLPPSVKFICHLGAGYDQVDIPPCTKRGIRVSNVPQAVDDSTADTALFLMLGALRRFNRGLFALRRNEWRGADVTVGHDPQGKTLGILGMGGIGRVLARRARSFDMKIIYHNRKQLPPSEAADAEYVSFDELLARSDVLSLNLPLNPHTHHIIGEEQFKKMKKGVVIVNTARGAVMDEDALVKALDDGTVFSAGLDVFEHEPKIHPGLMNNEHVMLLPHLGTNSIETQRKMEELWLNNGKNALLCNKLLTPVIEQKHL